MRTYNVKAGKEFKRHLHGNSDLKCDWHKKNHKACHPITSTETKWECTYRSVKTVQLLTARGVGDVWCCWGRSSDPKGTLSSHSHTTPPILSFWFSPDDTYHCWHMLDYACQFQSIRIHSLCSHCFVLKDFIIYL